MGCLVVSFLVLFAFPMTLVVMVDRAERPFMTETLPLTLALIVALLLIARLLRVRRARRLRTPSASALAEPNWPADLSRAELEGYAIAWLRAHGWAVTLGSGPDPKAEAVYILARRGAVTLGVLCDQEFEEFNPAIIRTFALDIGVLGATQAVLLTMAPGPLPHPAEPAARAAGVRLLRVAELAELDALAPAATEPAEVAG